MSRHDQEWDLEGIKAALRRRHGGITHLSLSWGYGRNAISRALADPRYSSLVEKRIAATLRVHPHVLWPDRWSPEGRAVPRSGQRMLITNNPRKSCQKQKAA